MELSMPEESSDRLQTEKTEHDLILEQM